ncbi:MAG TPA: hypothetical protein PKA00_13440 [Saprospiraceae bacterium]|nr:hypothetical protein [Saprospiraceae bacterium]HMQ83913.1 hypothetical protein [Saprospiraceae bacterium]
MSNLFLFIGLLINTLSYQGIPTSEYQPSIQPESSALHNISSIGQIGWPDKGEFKNIGPLLASAAMSEIGVFDDKNGDTRAIVFYRPTEEEAGQIALFNLSKKTGKFLLGSYGKMHDPVYHEELHKVYIPSGNPGFLTEVDLSTETSKVLSIQNTKEVLLSENMRAVKTGFLVPDKGVQAVAVGSDGHVYLGEGILGHIQEYDPYKGEMRSYGIVDDPGANPLLTQITLDGSKKELEAEVINPALQTISPSDYEVVLLNTKNQKETTAVLSGEKFYYNTTITVTLSYTGAATDYSLILREKKGKQILDRLELGLLSGANSNTAQTYTRFRNSIGGIKEKLDASTAASVYRYEWLGTGNKKVQGTNNSNQKFKHYRYVYAIGGDADYIYGTVRNQAFWYIVVINKKTLEQTLHWKYSTMTCAVRKAVDKKGKVHWIAQKGGQRFLLEGKNLKALNANEVSQYTLLDNNSNITTDRDFIPVYFPYEIEYSSLTPANGQVTLKYKPENAKSWQQISIDGAATSPLDLKGIFPVSSEQLMGYFEDYYPLLETNLKTHNSVGTTIMAYYDHLLYDENRLFLCGYPKSLVEYELHAPWTVESKRPSESTNPRLIKLINAKHITNLARSEKGWVYVIGRHNRDGKIGAELAWIHPDNNRSGRFTDTESLTLSNYGLQDMKTVSSNGKEYLVLLLKHLLDKEEAIALFDVSNHNGQAMKPITVFTMQKDRSALKQIAGSDQNGIYIASENELFVFDPQSKKIKTDLVLPKGSKITTMTEPDPVHNTRSIAYFFIETDSGGTMLYSLTKHQKATPLTDDLGKGKSRRITCWNDQLILYNGNNSITPYISADGREVFSPSNIELFHPN